MNEKTEALGSSASEERLHIARESPHSHANAAARAGRANCARPSIRTQHSAPRKRTAERQGSLAPGALWTPTNPATPRKRHDRHDGRTLPWAIGVAAFALAAATCIGAFFAFGGASAPSAANKGAADLVANDVASNSPGAASSKLAGATETTDENGVVHGVTPDGISYTVHGRGTTGAQEDRVTLAAVGDQIGTDNSLPIADAYAGSVGDGAYSFAPFYQEAAPFIQSYDLRYINQETVMAGNENGYAYSGYPMFNTPDAAADAIAEVGFNLVNFATNHIFDMGSYGIERSHEVWNRYPELIVAGSYPTAEERNTVQMIERNGMTFAFLAYTYGDNSYLDPANMPNDYYLLTFDKDVIRADVERAQQVADAVIVSMHWGTEYTSEPNDQQIEYAQFLVDLGVDLVLGTHAHIMQPVRLLSAPDGTTVPVVFGLSDFISGWTLVDTILSGVFTCEFVPDGAGGVMVENPVWHPTIEWSNGGDVYVRFLKGMDQAETDANTRTDDVWGSDYEYLRRKVESVGMEIPVDW